MDLNKKNQMLIKVNLYILIVGQLVLGLCFINLLREHMRLLYKRFFALTKP